MEELQKAIETLIADRDRWRAIAEQAIANCNQALALLENMQAGTND